MFLFPQIIAVFVAKHFRNQRDPVFNLPVRAIFPKENYEYCWLLHSLHVTPWQLKCIWKIRLVLSFKIYFAQVLFKCWWHCRFQSPFYFKTRETLWIFCCCFESFSEANRLTRVVKNLPEAVIDSLSVISSVLSYQTKVFQPEITSNELLLKNFLKHLTVFTFILLDIRKQEKINYIKYSNGMTCAEGIFCWCGKMLKRDENNQGNWEISAWKLH